MKKIRSMLRQTQMLQLQFTLQNCRNREEVLFLF